MAQLQVSIFMRLLAALKILRLAKENKENRRLSFIPEFKLSQLIAEMESFLVRSDLLRSSPRSY